MEAVFLAGAVQALFFAIIVLNKRNKHTADNILGIWLASLTLALLFTFLIYREGSYTNNVLLSALVGLLSSQPVWFYLYTCSLTEKPKTFKIKELLHFTPAIVSILFFIPLFKLDTIQIEGIYNRTEAIPKLTVYGGLPLLGLINIYILLSLIRIRKHKKELKYLFSFEKEVDLNWLIRLTYSFIVIILFGLLMFGLFSFTELYNGLVFDYLFGLSYVGFVFTLGYFGYKQGRIFSHTTIVLEGNTKIDHRINKVSRPINSAQENAKLATQLNTYIKDQKPWLNQKLSLYDLASELGMTSHQLSALLNDYLKTTFYDFINHFRVEEAKKRLKSNNNRLTILAIALESGFNSKASFNRVFKIKTGSTPSEYLKLVKRQEELQ